MTDAEKKARRKAIFDAFVGKTIKSVEADSVNVWTFHFTDGSQQQLEAEQAVSTRYGCIAGIFMAQELAIKP